AAMLKSRTITVKELSITGLFCGRKNSASRNSRMVTTSTDNWVNARSGAEKEAKAMETIRPTTDKALRATSRRWLHHSVTKVAAIISAAQKPTTQFTGSCGCVPTVSIKWNKGAALTASASKISSSI